MQEGSNKARSLARFDTPRWCLSGLPLINHSMTGPAHHGHRVLRLALHDAVAAVYLIRLVDASINIPVWCRRGPVHDGRMKQRSSLVSSSSGEPRQFVKKGASLIWCQKTDFRALSLGQSASSTRKVVGWRDLDRPAAEIGRKQARTRWTKPICQSR